MITAAKSLGNGFPIGLTVATPEIANAYQGPTIATFGRQPDCLRHRQSGH